MKLPFHLCQPGGEASCGACCGLYNFRDHSRVALAAALGRRTARLARAPRTAEAFGAAARELGAQERPPLFSDVRLCPLLGFLDAGRSRVGCLAHPDACGGLELRGCGAYGADVCRSFECPSYLWLEDWQARLVQRACPDWYVYGLVVTDVEFVRGCLALVESERAGPVRPAELERPAVVRAFGALFALKESASGRGDGADVVGRFAPDGTGDAALRTLDYAALKVGPAPEDGVALCLGHAPATGAALLAAREEIRARVREVAAALVLDCS